MATTIDSSNPLAAYGYDAKTGQQLAQSLGMTTQQLAAALATTQSTSPSGQSYNPEGANYAPSPTGQGNVPGPAISSAIQQLQMLKAAGLGGAGNQSGQAPSSNQVPVSNDPMNAAANWGASAINTIAPESSAGRAIYNPIPGQASGKGGVAQVGSPTSSDTSPTAPSLSVASVFGQPSQQSQGLQYWGSTPGGGSAADAAKIEQANGMAPGTIGNQFYQAGVQAGKIQPNAINPAPASGGTPVGVTPANAPGAGQPATPWATAPQAPIDLAQHTSALEKAGRAIYDHYGGNSEDATPKQILDFHQALNDHISGLFGQAPPGAANYTAGVQAGIPATGATPQSALGVSPPAAPVGPPRMATGGFVPGRGNQDTVPAMLTPGEYVIPKQQAAQMFAGRTPIRMAQGGYVPPETRRQRITPPGSPPPAPSQDQPTSSDQQRGQSSNPDSQSYGSGTNWAQVAQQARAAQIANGNVGSGGAGSIDSLGRLGDESIITGQGGAGGATSAATGAISTLADGLTKAAKTYADAFKPYQVRPYQQLGNQVSSSQPAAQLQQDEVT